ncbi:MAG: hypothetical protein KBH99_00730 [Syntrophobacteraceae bacterium]|nr:hypothetical protein [Syntrophobacteraceae bacterium]
MIFSIQAVLGATLLYAGWMTLDRHFTAGVVMCLVGVLCSVRPVLQVGGVVRQMWPASPKASRKKRSAKIIEIQPRHSQDRPERKPPTIH